jgi:hypothetical protein
MSKGVTQRSLRKTIQAMLDKQPRGKRWGEILALLALAQGFFALLYEMISPLPNPYIGFPLALGFSFSLVGAFWLLFPWNKSIKMFVSSLLVTTTISGSLWLMRRPTIAAIASSDIVSRIYMRTNVPLVRPGETITTDLKPFLQELFYDWTLRISTSRDVQSEVVITIRDDAAPLDDRIKVTPPDNATVLESVPGWLSGFKEPREPDYYSRTIRLSMLATTTIIELRRPIKFPALLSERTFSRSYNVKASRCHIETTAYDMHGESQKLLAHFKTLSLWPWLGPKTAPLPTKIDPNIPDSPLMPGEAESTVEARCEDSACAHLTVGNMEARRPLPAVPK